MWDVVIYQNLRKLMYSIIKESRCVGIKELVNMKSLNEITFSYCGNVKDNIESQLVHNCYLMSSGS